MTDRYEAIRFGDRDEWLQLRTNGIGGSDVSALMGVNNYKSPLALWLEKTGRAEPPDLSGNEAVQWGVTLEPIIRAKFQAMHPELTVQEPNAIYRSLECPWEQATLDGEVYDPATGDFSVLEIKTVGERRSDDWDKGVPIYYLAQVTHYLNVTGWRRAYVAALIGGQRYVEFIVEPDEEDREAVRDAVRKFWGMVQRDEAPALVGKKDEAASLTKLHAHPEDEVRQLGPDLDGLIDRYVDLTGRIKEAEAERQDVANAIKQVIGDSKGITTDVYKATWVRAKRRRLDVGRLSREHPDLISDYYVEQVMDGGLRVGELK